MLRFDNGLRAALMMSAAGETDAGAAAGGGNAAPSAFLASLPEDLRGHEALKDVADAPALAKRYVEASTFRIPDKYTKDNPALKDIKSMDGLVESLVGAQKLVGLDKNRLAVLPKDDKDDAGYDALYKSLGRPETADKYALGKRADGKDYSPEDQAFQKAVLPLLHEVGLTQRQLDKLQPKWDAVQSGFVKAHDDKLIAESKAAGESLRKDWGADFDGNLELASSAIAHYSAELKLGDGLTKELNKSTIGNLPALAKLLSHMGAQLKEDGVLGKHAGGMGDGMSVEAAKAEIVKLEKDAEFGKVYRDKAADGHKDAVAKMAALYAAAYPEQKPE